MKERVVTYDLMKGIAILLMMVSHLALNYGLPKQIIYSFHMPLFFILAGVFAKDIAQVSSFRQYTIKNAKRLLLPYVVTMLMLCAWGGIQAYAKHNVSFFLRHLFSMLMPIFVWPFAIIYGCINIESCTIQYYPLSLIGACGGTYVIYLLCKTWSKVLSSINSINIKHHTSNIISPLAWCGMYSLPILCMHTFEMHSDLYYSVMCRIPILCERVWGGAIAIFFAWIILKIPYLKEVYK